MCPSPSNTTSSLSWSIEYPRALNEASEIKAESESESFAVPPHTFPQPYSHNTTNLYTTTSSTSMDSIENNKIPFPHPDAMHPPGLNQATLLPENLQEDKSALTVEECMAHIWDKHQVKEKRRKQLVLRAQAIVADYMEMKREQSAPPGPATYEDIVVATATQVTQTYLKRCAAKEVSQCPSSMLKLSMPKVMTGVLPATRRAGGTISPQASSSACATCSSSSAASSTWSVEYPRAVDKASVTSGRTPGPRTQSSKPRSLLQPQAVHIQSWPSHDDTSCFNERPKVAPLLCEASYTPTTLTFILLITGLTVVSTSDCTAVSGAIAARKY